MCRHFWLQTAERIWPESSHRILSTSLSGLWVANLAPSGHILSRPFVWVRWWGVGSDRSSTTRRSRRPPEVGSPSHMSRPTVDAAVVVNVTSRSPFLPSFWRPHDLWREKDGASSLFRSLGRSNKIKYTYVLAHNHPFGNEGLRILQGLIDSLSSPRSHPFRFSP